MARIAFSCEQPVFAAGFEDVFGGDLELSGVFSEAVALREHLRTSGPDLLVLEVSPSFTLEELRALRVLAPGVAIVLWVDRIPAAFVSQTLSLGVRGVLRQTATAEQCQRCLREVARGGAYIDHTLSEALRHMRQVKMTPREHQLVGLLVQGLRNKEIAWELGISEGTVKIYLSRLFSRAGASDRFELAQLALENFSPQPLGDAESVSSGMRPAGISRLFPGVGGVRRDRGSAEARQLPRQHPFGSGSLFVPVNYGAVCAIPHY